MAERSKVRRIADYSSNQDILLVGEGDFSFSLSLALAFGSATNIVATSLDTHDELRRKYGRAESNVAELRRLGALVLHGVDATQMFGGRHGELNSRRFDRIVFNFPHSGFQHRYCRGRMEDSPHVIDKHKRLVEGFFRNAAHMVRPFGEVHVAHKTAEPFCRWNIVELAQASSLIFLDEVEFRKEDFPHYRNKRGDGGKADQSFPLGACSTFKFW